MGRVKRIFAILCVFLTFTGCNFTQDKKMNNIEVKSTDINKDYFVFPEKNTSFFSSETKYGYMNSLGEIIISPYFKYAEDFSDGFARVQTGEGYGIIDKSGKYVLMPHYSNCNYLGNGLIAYKTDKWGIKDYSGKDLIKPEYDEIYSFSEELAAVKLGDKWGFIGTDGTLKIKPEFDLVNSFCNGLSNIKVNSKWGLIDTSGKVIVEPKYDNKLQVSDDLILLQGDNYKWGYLDKLGNKVIDYIYEKADYFGEGFAAVYVSGKWGYINKQGNFEIEPCFEEAKRFRQGLARVKKDNKYFYINKKGEMIKETGMDYTGMFEFNEGMAAIINNHKYGFINEKMETIVEPKYDEYKDFSEGFAVVGEKISGSYDSVYGYIDKEGKWLVEPSFTEAESFKEGLAKVWKSGKMGYIDNKGNIVYKSW
ncbi:MAG: KWG Leptospira [Firmicutes bacterium ADurb.Bin419]|nr:MAG: KWG Leptospira [Firmicutes bacterium ADurb.Bin419]